MGLPPEHVILTRSDPHLLPPPSRLESTALHLEARGDLRTLISYVERWSEHAQPSIRARLAQARALLSLGLMDRAWTRLQDLVESGEGGADAIVAAGQMYLRRGWLKQGRALLQRTMGDYPEDRRLIDLWEQLTGPAQIPDLDAADREDASTAQLLAAADHYMATGAFVKARGVLERLKRTGQASGRVTDLLWALDGDFRIPGTLAQLTDAYGPDLSFLGELGDLADESEHTAEADRDTPYPDPSEPKPASFPSLFRHLEGRTEQHREEEEEPEVTQLSSMAELDEMRHAAMEYTETGGDDTQIMRVIHKQPDGAPPPRPDSLSFDLTAIHRELDVAPRSDIDFIDPRPEAEDDDLIIRTHQDTTSELRPKSSTRAGLNLASEPTPAPRRAVRLSDEDEAWARPETPAAPPSRPASAPSPPTPSAAASTSREELAEEGHPTVPWAFLVLGAALVFMGGSVILVVLLQVLRSMLF